MLQDTKLLGFAAETFALRLYEKARFKILARNYRFGHYEVDIIAQRDDIIHFIEVKYRKTLIDANLALNDTQFNRIAKAAEHYMFGRSENMQIDAILVDHKLQWQRFPNIMIEQTEGKSWH